MMPHFRLSILNHKSLPKHPVLYGYFFFLRVIHDGQKFQVFKRPFSCLFFGLPYNISSRGHGTATFHTEFERLRGLPAQIIITVIKIFCEEQRHI